MAVVRESIAATRTEVAVDGAEGRGEVEVGSDGVVEVVAMNRAVVLAGDWDMVATELAATVAKVSDTRLLGPGLRRL
jgi:hypothetical protein